VSFTRATGQCEHLPLLAVWPTPQHQALAQSAVDLQPLRLPMRQQGGQKEAGDSEGQRHRVQHARTRRLGMQGCGRGADCGITERRSVLPRTGPSRRILSPSPLLRRQPRL